MSDLDRIVERRLENIIASIADLCICKQEMAKLRITKPSRDTVRPGSLGLTLVFLLVLQRAQLMRQLSILAAR